MNLVPVRLLAVLAAALLLQACSALRLGYGNADSLGRWWIDQYVDLSPEQDALTRDGLARLHAWHRRTQLPDYANLLRQARGLATGRMTGADAMTLTDALIRRLRTVTDQALPDAADLLATLTPAQIDRMSARLTERTADFAKDLKLAEGDAAQRRARLKRLVERAEYWFGDISDEQQAAIRRLVDAQPTGAQFWYEERLRRQRDWLELVRRIQAEKPSRERSLALLRDYTERFDLPTDPARRATAIALRKSAAELTANVQALTTPAQREHARQKFDDLIRELTELASEI